MECSICLNIMHGTVAITTCMHRFCSSCLMEYMIQKVGSICCPNCRASLDIDDIMISPELSDILDKSMVKCKNKECLQKIPRKEYKKHIRSCIFNKKKCNGCKSLYYEKDHQTHMDECDQRLVKCDSCNSYTKSCDQITHREESCPEAMVKCPNKKCNFITQMYKINLHIASCEHKIITCFNGCDASFDIKDRKYHEDICPLRAIKCTFCNINTPYNSLEEHYKICLKKNVECDWCFQSIIRGSIMAHELVCEKKRIQCSQGCGMEMERGELIASDHIGICPNRNIKCDDCLQNYIFSLKEEHDKICLEKVISCIDCSQSITRKDIYGHSQKGCEMKIIRCKYEYAGCMCKFSRKFEKEHYKDYQEIHLNLLDTFIKKLKIKESSINYCPSDGELSTDYSNSLSHRLFLLGLNSQSSISSDNNNNFSRRDYPEIHRDD